MPKGEFNYDENAHERRKREGQQRDAKKVQDKIDKQNRILEELLANECKGINVGEFSRILPAFLDPDDTEKAKQRNIETLNLLSTEKGRAEFMSKAMDSLLDMDLDLFTVTNPNDILTFVNRNYKLCFLCWDFNWTKKSGVASKEVEQLFNKNRALFECMGDCMNVVSGILLPEFLDESLKGKSDLEIDLYSEQNPDKNSAQLRSLYDLYQRKPYYGVFRKNLKTTAFKGKTIKDFLNTKFTDETGKVLTGSEAFRALCSGKKVLAAEKTLEEKATLDEMVLHPAENKDLYKERDERIAAQRTVRQQRQARAKKILERHKKQGQIRDKLKLRFQKPDVNNPFQRVADTMMNPDDTREANLHNLDVMDLMFDQKGQIELLTRSLKSLLDVNIKDLTTNDPDKILDFAEKNWDVLYLGYDPSYINHFNQLNPETKKFFDSCNLLFQECGDVLSMVRGMTMPEYVDGYFDDMEPNEVITYASNKPKYAKIMEPDRNISGLEYLFGIRHLKNRAQSYVDLDKRFEEAGFKGTTIRDFVNHKFVDGNNKELSVSEAFQSIVDNKPVSGTPKSVKEQEALDELINDPASRIILKFNRNASAMVSNQKSEIDKLAPAKSLADYKMLLSVVLSKLPKEISDDKNFKDALKPLGDLKKFTGSKKDLQNLSKSWDLLDKYADGLEQKMFDDPDLELDDQVAQVRSVMSMLDNMELEAKKVLPASKGVSASAATVLKNDAGIVAARNLMMASAKFLKYVDPNVEPDAFKKELASIVVCDKFIRACENSGKAATQEEFMGGYDAAVEKLAGNPMMEKLIKNPNVNAAIMQVSAVNSKEDPALFNDVVRVLSDVVVQSANEIQKGPEAKQAEPKMTGKNLGK